MSHFPSRAWRTPFLLLLVAFLPLLTSAMRLHWMSHAQTSPDIDPSFLHFLEVPTPILIHMIGGSFFCLAAIFQLTPEIRKALGPWHKRLGRLALLSGMAAALTGVWMVVYYPTNPMTLPAMSAGRALFGILLALSFIMAMIAIGRRDITNHRSWMMRAFSIATAGASQGILIMSYSAATGVMTAQTVAIMAWIGWIIHVVASELLIMRANRLAPYSSRLAG